MTYEILQENDPRAEEIERFVNSHLNGHFLQSPAWAGVKPLWSWQGVIAMDDQGRIAGAASVLLRKLPFGCHVAYAPRGPVCDRNDRAVMEQLTLGLKALAQKNKCILTYLDPDEETSNNVFRDIMKEMGFQEKCCEDFGGVQAQTVFRLSLADKKQEDLMDGFTPKTRYNIRLAQRKGVTVKVFSGAREIPAQAMEAFTQLMKTTGQRDHFRTRDRDYFENIFSAFGDNAVLYLACLEGKAIAGTIAVFYAGKAWYLYGASANEHRAAMPNYLLQWTMICQAQARGCHMYDLRGVPGREDPNDPLYGLYRFKKGFGGAYIHFTGLFICCHKPLLGRLFDFAQTAFRKLRRKSTT